MDVVGKKKRKKNSLSFPTMTTDCMQIESSNRFCRIDRMENLVLLDDCHCRSWLIACNVIRDNPDSTHVNLQKDKEKSIKKKKKNEFHEYIHNWNSSTNIFKTISSIYIHVSCEYINTKYILRRERNRYLLLYLKERKKGRKKVHVFYLFEENQPAVSFVATFARSMSNESRPCSVRDAPSPLTRHQLPTSGYLPLTFPPRNGFKTDQKRRINRMNGRVKAYCRSSLLLRAVQPCRPRLR